MVIEEECLDRKLDSKLNSQTQPVCYRDKTTGGSSHPSQTLACAGKKGAAKGKIPRGSRPH